MENGIPKPLENRNPRSTVIWQPQKKMNNKRTKYVVVTNEPLDEAIEKIEVTIQHHKPIVFYRKRPTYFEAEYRVLFSDSAICEAVRIELKRRLNNDNIFYNVFMKMDESLVLRDGNETYKRIFEQNHPIAWIVLE